LTLSAVGKSETSLGFQLPRISFDGWQMPLLQTLAAEREGSSGGASTAVSRFIRLSAHTCALGLFPRLPVVRQDRLRPGHCGLKVGVADELVTFQGGTHGNPFAGSRRNVRFRSFEPDNFPPAKHPDIDARLG